MGDSRRTGTGFAAGGGLLSLLVLLSPAACDPPPPHAYVAGDDGKFARLRFEDGAVSPNDRCPVKKKVLNRKMDPVLINGRSVGFC